MTRYTTPHTAPITRVNVTPLIDVALVLVIILLVTAPLLPASDVPVNLPAATTREAENQRNISITLGSDGRLALDDEVVAPGELRTRLAARLAEPGNDGVLVVVRADAGIAYVQVRALLDQARLAGARRLAIATRQAVGVSS